MTKEPTARVRKKRRKKKAKAAPDAADTLAAQLRENAFVVLRHQRLLGLGATISAVGLALVGTHESKAGSMVVIVGLLILMWSVHRFGRLGTERVS